MRRFFLSLLLFALCSATLHGEQPTRDKKPRHQGTEARSLVSNIPGDRVPLSLADYRRPRDWGQIDPSYRLGEEWFPFSVKPPFGKDDGAAKPWMVYAGPARITAKRGAPAAPTIPNEMKIQAPLGSRPAFYIVHFTGPIRSEWKKAVIAAGAVCTENYLPNNALLFHMTPQAYAKVKALPDVDWIGYHEPAYKLDPMIGRLPIDARVQESDHTDFIVSLYGGVDPHEAKAELEAMGLVVLDDIDSIKAEKHAPRPWHSWKLTVRATRDRAIDMAWAERVQYVSESPTVKYYNAFSAGGILQSGDSASWSTLGSTDPAPNDASFFPMWDRNLRGQHQMIGISDTGIDYGVNSLFATPVNPLDTNPDYDLKVPKASLRDGSTDPCDISGGHGTGVAGSCCQDWHDNDLTENREGNVGGRGEFGEAIAHEAQVVMAPNGGYATFLPTTQRLQWLDLGGFGASVMNTSWSWCTGATTTYDFQSEMFDLVTDTNEYFLITASAGNAGNCPTFDTVANCQTTSWAKNSVDVGASDDLSLWDEMVEDPGFGGAGTDGSNKGPDWSNPPGSASDDLIFPDVVASATDSTQATTATITASADGTCQNSDSGIQGFGGTSGAAPTVAGAVALIHQYYEEGNVPTITDPTAALMKATLINSAEQMASSCSGSGRPGGDQGWGRPNLSSSLAFSSGTPTAFVMNAFDVPNASGFSGSGQFQEQVIDITNANEPLKITLAWTDVPSTPGSGRPYLVNNLDLRLEKGGTFYYGNNFDPALGISTSATSASDGANTVENIFLSAAQVQALGTGNATIRVTMVNAPTGRNQGYGLVAVGGLAPATSVFFDQNVYNCADQLSVTVADGSPSATALVTGPTDSETVTLVSIGNDRYQATITTAEGDTTADNGILGVSNGDALDVTYETVHTDSAAVTCQMDLSTGAVALDGGCDSWDGNNPTVNTGEKYSPYPDTDEVMTLTYVLENDGLEDVENVTALLSESSGCLTIFGANPAPAGTVPAGGTAGASWSVLVGSCANLTPTTFTLSATGTGYTTPAVLNDVSGLINADDSITEYSTCFDHSTADMTSLPWTAAGHTDIAWQHATQNACAEEDRTDGTCADSGSGMYKTNECGNGPTGLIPDNSAGTIVPPSPIPFNNTGSVGGQPWRHALKRFSFYAATSEPGSDDVYWGIFFEDQYTSPTQITDGEDPINQNWGWSLGFFSMESFECCGGSPAAWDWESANTGTPGADDFCGVSGTAPENQLNICFGSAETGVLEGGENGNPGDNFLNFAFMALEEQLVGQPAGPNTKGFGVDNLELVWEEFHAAADTGDCSVSGQCGQVSFDRVWYQTDCSGETATITVIDDNGGAGPLVATVTSATAGDSEAVTLVKQGGDPVYVGTVVIATDDGAGVDDGTLLAVPDDDLTATYNDADDGTTNPCSDVATAETRFGGGLLSIDSVNFYFDNGDDDGNADTNETVTFELTIQNNTAAAITNAVVTVETASPHVACMINDTANFGTIPAGGTAENPDMERFEFQVSSSYECSNPADPDTVEFVAHVVGDGFCGSSTLLKRGFLLDVDQVVSESVSSYAGYAGPDATAIVGSQQTLTRGPEPDDSPEGFEVATCGNAQYDDGDPETSAWFGGGEAGNPDCIMAELFNPSDFGIFTDYEISDICFGNEIDWGGPWPNRWRIHPDNAGAPDDTITLAEGVMSTGDGAGQVEFMLAPTVQLSAGEKFWVFVRGDSSCCNSQDFNWDLDQSTSLGHRYINTCDGLVGLSQAADGEFVVHTTLASTATFDCDTTDNSSLPNNCGVPAVSDNPALPLTVDLNGSLVDLVFENVGSSLNYDVYVSTSPETVAATPFDVENPGGKRDCSVSTADLGATRSITGHDVETGLSPSSIYYILVGASDGAASGPLGNNTPEGQRNATGYCAP